MNPSCILLVYACANSLIPIAQSTTAVSVDITAQAWYIDHPEWYTTTAGAKNHMDVIMYSDEMIEELGGDVETNEPPATYDKTSLDKSTDWYIAVVTSDAVVFCAWRVSFVFLDGGTETWLMPFGESGFPRGEGTTIYKVRSRLRNVRPMQVNVQLTLEHGNIRGCGFDDYMPVPNWNLNELQIVNEFDPDSTDTYKILLPLTMLNTRCLEWFLTGDACDWFSFPGRSTKLHPRFDLTLDSKELAPLRWIGKSGSTWWITLVTDGTIDKAGLCDSFCATDDDSAINLRFRYTDGDNETWEDLSFYKEARGTNLMLQDFVADAHDTYRLASRVHQDNPTYLELSVTSVFTPVEWLPFEITVENDNGLKVTFPPAWIRCCGWYTGEWEHSPGFPDDITGYHGYKMPFPNTEPIKSKELQTSDDNNRGYASQTMFLWVWTSEADGAGTQCTISVHITYTNAEVERFDDIGHNYQGGNGGKFERGKQVSFQVQTRLFDNAVIEKIRIRSGESLRGDCERTIRSDYQDGQVNNNKEYRQDDWQVKEVSIQQGKHFMTFFTNSFIGCCGWYDEQGNLDRAMHGFHRL